MTTANISPTVPGGPYLVDEFDVGNLMAGTPSNPSAAVLGNGNIVTVWEVSGSPDGATPAKVYGQVHDENGTSLGGIVEIASGTGAAELKPVVTVLEDNSYVIAYGASPGDVGRGATAEYVAYRVVSGNIVGEEQLVGQTGMPQTGHAITTLENGDFVIGWTEDGSIMTQTFAGSGHAGLAAGQPYQLASSLGNTNPAANISLTGLSDDNFAVSFVDANTSNIFLATSENMVSIPGSMSGFGNEPAPDGVVIAQISYDGADRPSSAGLPETDIATLKGDRVVVTWDSWIVNGPSGSGSGISYSILDTATGISDPWGVRAASEETIGNQAGVTVTAMSGGGFVLAWENGGTGDAAEIMGRSFDANGHGMHHAFPINQDFFGAQTSPTLVAFDDNTFGTVWVDTPAGGHGVRIEGRVSIIPPVGMPDLAPESDSGANHEDNVTNNAWLRFNGSVGPVNDAADVSVFIDLNRNGQLDNGDAIGTSSARYGQYTVDMDTPRDVEGTFNVFAFATDSAGRAGPLSTPLQVTIDTLAPTNVVEDVWFGDRYTPSKMVTNSLQPVLHGELAQPLQVGETVQVNVNGNWQDLPVLPGQTQWAAPIDLAHYQYQNQGLQLRVVDSAGNDGQQLVVPFKVDIDKPWAQLISTPFVEMPASDLFVIDIRYEDMQTGFAPQTFNNSNITVSFGNTTLEVISAGIKDFNGNIGGNINGGINEIIVSYTVRAPGGTWDPADAGPYLVSFNAQTIRDTAGNALDAPGFYLHVSPREVVTPSTPDLVDLFDTGDSFSDDVTAATTIAVTGTINEPDGGQVTAFIDIDNNAQFDAEVDHAGSGTVHDGAWTIEGLDTAGLEGSYNIYAFHAAGSATPTNMPLNVTFDHIAPGRSVGMRMSEDTGASSSDLVTRSEFQQLTFSFDAPIAHMDYAEIRINGADGWIPLQRGFEPNEWLRLVHLNQAGFVEVRARDSAGNVGEIVRHDYVVDYTGGSAHAKAEDVSSPGATEYSFKVVYTDIGAGIDLSTIGLNNVQVQGPAGNLLPVLRFEVMNDTTISPFSALLPTGPVTGPQEVTVKYTVEAPGGSWDQGDDGTYVANVVMGQVLDRAGNPIMFAMGDLFDVMLKPANASPTGIVTITGTASAGQTLTASNTLDDLDGIAPNGIAYQWQAGGVDIAGATASTFTLGREQVGKVITVVASYTDLKNNLESQVSAATAQVTHVNTAPTGGVTIAGEAKQGGTLTASNTLADADGIGSNGISYQWQANGVDIANATGATLLLGQEHVGKAITVVAKYIDQQGTAEAPVSLATAAVANVNDMPTGSVTISGTAAQGHTLTAVNTLDDADGIAPGSITYQWKADGVDIAGATGSALVLTSGQNGKAITVVAAYTDARGTVESVASLATASVVDVNDKPVVTATAATAAQYVAGNAGGVSLFANVALSTVEDGQAISEVVLRVSGLKDAGSETLLIGGKSLALVDGTSVALDIGGTAKVVLVDGALTVSIRNAEGWSAASAEAMIEGIQYSNTATAPTFAGQRSVELASVKDNGGTALGGSDTAFVAITSTATVVAAPEVTPPGTSATVDGVTVQTGQITNPDGTVSQTLTVPVIVPNRTEQVGNNGVADIPLVTGTNGQALLSAQVSTGIGLTITGSNEAKSAGNSLADLIREIKAHTTAGSADQNQLTGGGSGFLSDLPATTNLLVQTIVPTAAPGATSPGQALVINGTPSSANTPMTALVIDTRALPGGSTIQLNNVEFAAVIGSVRVTGGAGSQNVWGDGESQFIMLGADDDVLHGGAGNDTVGSAGGNDKVYGDEGDDLVFGGIGNDLLDGGTGRDTAEFTGNGRASYSLRVKDGNIVITDLHGDDGIDTLASVEQLRFTSEQADTSLHGTVTRLLEAATGKAPDLISADRWLDVAQKGTDLAAVANSLIAGAGLDKLDNAAFVSAMYRNVLHRDADATGAAYWSDALAAGTVDRAGMVLSMAESAEKLALPQSLDMDFNMSDVATLVRMYSTLFGRAGDEGGLNFWIGMYESGASLSGVADAFVASSEADARYRAMTDEQFIESLYQVAFDRVGQANEVGYWVDGLEAGAIDRGEVLLSFANSAEQIELIGTIGTSFATL